MNKWIYATSLFLLVVLSSSCTRYDHDKPDTKANRGGFKRHIGFAPPKTVSGLYYYADEMGADPTYQLGFKTDSKTIDKIVSGVGLTQKKTNFDVTGREFPWWKNRDIEGLTPYWKSNVKKNYFWFLWYNRETRLGYYLEFGV